MHHGVQIQDNALVAAVMLSHRYISDRFLPDKAIDLVDEACAMLRTEIDSMPAELDELTRRVMRLEIEETALAKEKDAASEARLDELRKELARPARPRPTPCAPSGRPSAGAAQGARRCARRSSTRQEAEQAERAYDLNRAAELRLRQAARAGAPSSQAEEEQLAPRGQRRLLRGGRHRGGDRRRSSSRWTGIPVSRLHEGEREKLLRLDEMLHERVIGQDEAVQAGHRRDHPRPRPASRTRAGPIGSFIFLGPTGVGQDRAGQDAGRGAVRHRGQHGPHRHERVPGKAHGRRLVGAPPGYVGYDEGGQLTEAVRRKPYSVVLFDEIEKAHPDVFNTLLQVLDDGRLTDAQGRTVDFRNTIIIMTSNIGSRVPARGRDVRRRDQARGARARHGRAARPLPAGVPQPDRRHRAVQAADAGRDRADRRAAARRPAAPARRSARSTLELTEEARRFIASQGFDPVYGARPLRRFIAREVETRDRPRTAGRGRPRRGRDPGSISLTTSSSSTFDHPAQNAHVPTADHSIAVPQLRTEEPRAGGRGRFPRCGNCHSPFRGSPTPTTTTSPRSPKARPYRSWSTCGRPGVGPAAGEPGAGTLAQEFAGRVKLVKVNADEAPRLQPLRRAGDSHPDAAARARIVAPQAGAPPAPRCAHGWTGRSRRRKHAAPANSRLPGLAEHAMWPELLRSSVGTLRKHARVEGEPMKPDSEIKDDVIRELRWDPQVPDPEASAWRSRTGR